jgi:hypothetical protein
MKQAELDKKAEGPTSVQEYEYLKAHPEAAAFFEQRSKAGGTTIYTGEDGSALPTPEAGHAYAHGPDGKVLMRQVEGQPEGVLAPVSVPIFGSKAAGEQESAQKASDKRASEEKRTANIMSEDIGRGIDIINQNEGVTGFPGEVSKNIPGTPSHNLAKLLDGVKANIGFDRLQQMRAASPTGAALGSVQVRELEMLQSVWGSVEQSQTRDQLRYNLNRLRIATDEVVNGPGGAQQQQQQQPKIPTAEEYFGGR